MNERLTLSQILLLMTYSVGMSGGQVLFKTAAIRYAAFDGTVGEAVRPPAKPLFPLGAPALQSCGYGS